MRHGGWPELAGDAGIFEAPMSAPHSRLSRLLHRVEGGLYAHYHQLPLFVPALLSIGIAQWFAWGNGAFWPLISGICGLIIAALLQEKGSLRRVLMITMAILILAGFLLIAWRADSVAQSQLERPWTGRLYARVDRADLKAALDKEYLYLDTDGRQDLPRHIRVSRALDSDQLPVQSGDVVIIRARLMPPPPPAVPGSYDFAQRAFFDEIGATGSVLGKVRVVRNGPRTGNSQFLQKPLAQFIQTRMTGDAGAIAATLASGDQGGISATADEWMRGSGMAHLLSISGLHVTAFVGAVYIILVRVLAIFPFFALRISIPIVAASGGAVAALFYTWLTGSEVPTIRSCIAALMVLLALATGRDPLSMRLLAIGALVVIVFWPEAVMGPSFQLSFAAVAAIIALHDSQPMRAMRARANEAKWPMQMAYGALGLFLTGLLVEATLSPIALYHFQKTGLLGAAANMIAIPLTTFVIMPLIALGLTLDWTGLAAPIWWCAQWALEGLLKVAEIAATAPGSQFVVPAFASWGFALYAIGLCFIFLLTTRARWLGLFPILGGVAVMMSSATPNVLVDSSGRHLAIRDADGQTYFLRAGQGDFVQDMMREQMGLPADFQPIARHKGSSCNQHACIIKVSDSSTGRSIRVLVTRDGTYFDYPSLIAACNAVDVVVSERALPQACAPKWLKADKTYLRANGGIALFISNSEVVTVAEAQKHLPWSAYSPEKQMQQQQADIIKAAEYAIKRHKGIGQ